MDDTWLDEVLDNSEEKDEFSAIKGNPDLLKKAVQRAVNELKNESKETSRDAIQDRLAAQFGVNVADVESEITLTLGGRSSNTGRARNRPAGGAAFKRTLLTRAEQLDTPLAIAELLDNIFENYLAHYERLREIRDKADLDIKLEFFQGSNQKPDNPDNGAIRITENSGGVPEKSIDALFQQGLSQWGLVRNSVGVWGEGMKISLPCLGRWSSIAFHHIDDEGEVGAAAGESHIAGFIYELGASKNYTELDAIESHKQQTHSNSKEPSEYYNPKNSNWRINPTASPINDNSKSPFKETKIWDERGWMQIDIKRLTEKGLSLVSSKEECDNLMIFLSKVYGHKVRKIIHELEENPFLRPNITITVKHPKFEGQDKMDGVQLNFVNPTQSLESMRKVFSCIPGFEPVEYTTTFKDTDHGEVEATFIVGMPHVHKYVAAAPLGDKWVDNNMANGLYMYGNGRLFQESYTFPNAAPTHGSLVWRKKYTSKPTRKGTAKWGDGNTAATGYAIGFVFFEGNSQAIPWKGPQKWEYRGQNSSISKQIEETFFFLAQPFMELGYSLQEMASGPFTRGEFQDFDPENLELLRMVEDGKEIEYKSGKDIHSGIPIELVDIGAELKIRIQKEDGRIVKIKPKAIRE